MPESSLPHAHENGVCKVLERMPKTPEFEKSADMFTQLSDATRLRILWILCHSEECVTNIAAAIGMSDPAVSHHLRMLKKAGLASSRRIGKEVHYTLAETQQAVLVHRMIDDMFEMNCPNCGIR